MYRIIIIFIIFGFAATVSYADTVTLKDGRTFTGTIIERQTDYIVIFYRNVPLKYNLDQIESINDDADDDMDDPDLQSRLKSFQKQPQVESIKDDAVDDPEAQREISVSLEQPAEFNFKTKQEIYEIRRNRVSQYQQLAPSNYNPSEEVFGQIQDGKPWWGLLGMCYYGNGEKSILGRSKEARFILNPYLLIGIEEPNAVIIHSTALKPEEFYPTPTRLVWRQNGSWGQVTYNVTGYYQKELKYSYPDPQKLYLSDYNARDFGFNYFAIGSSRSENITATFDKVIPIIQCIHTGGSCGYPGGCNNKSPNQPDLMIEWRRLPAKIYLKLWKGSPASATQKPDMTFVIDMI